MNPSLIIEIAVTALICTGIFSSCTKEEILVSKENNLFKQKHQKWNPDENSPFILTENPPFQYAIYNDDWNNLYGYIIAILEQQEIMPGEDPGYFILSFEDELINYGFLTVENPYYYLYKIDESNIPVIIDDQDEDDNGTICYAKIKTADEEKLRAWLDKQVAKGKTDITISPRDPETGEFHATAKKPK